jgi:SNF2 family DNA or RNA helicase
MITIDIRKSDKCNGDYSLFVSFPYDNFIVSTIRELPSRYWNKETKEWEVPIKKLNVLLEQFNKYDIKLIGSVEMLKAENQQSNCKICKIPANFTFKTSPFAHQIEGFNFGLSHDRWLLGDEQGLGKTKQVIDIAVAKKETCGYKHCLIVCGVNGLKWNWQNEIKTHSNETGWILGQRTKNKRVVIGSTSDKLHDLTQLNTISSYFLITNVESLRDEKISAKLSELCKSGEIQLVAIDEIHKCKNPSSQQGKGILKLQSECRIAMTGTPLMNTPMDLYIILKWLGYEKHSFYQFKQHYCVMGGFGGYEVVGYRNLDELQEQTQEIMLRRLKEDVLDLPDKLFIDEYVEMTGKQEQIYKEITAEIKANIDQIKIANNPLAELIRMRQATGYTGILSSTIQESAKIDRLVEIVEETVQNGKKIVIFSNWLQMTDPIYQRLSKLYEGVIITGETVDNERQSNVNKFQNDKNCKFILGTIGAMGTGLTLTAGTVVVFMDEPWTMANKQQAIDRCHRIGTKENVTVYTIMCKNTIDERIHEIVEKKGAMSDALIDGKVVGNKSELLNFLLN